ncbi:hypothetical protein LSH36_837g01037 [Paralvinella palmiformis]|uniref:Endonuclease/exonuclease/phosphatase domain-containing protein n=1 Tax=Paralvinella palmiformis TaxID=53620 RepID=A0AAD9J065_9ANNE|nr:hypothetical protein LSH36_837g01037 [Paralvinella palmiformis]
MTLREAAYSPFLIYFALNLISVKPQMHSSDNRFLGEPHKQLLIDGLTGFGGVLNEWVTDMLSNHTDVKEIIKFAAKYARSRHPLAFPPSRGSDYTMQVRNISRLKLVYSADGQSPAMFGAVDPVLQQSFYVPLVWGLLYTFYIHLVLAEWPAVVLIHRFTILEYAGHSMYVLEHSFHRETSANKENHLHMPTDQSGCLVSREIKASVEVDQSEAGNHHLGQCSLGGENGRLSSTWSKFVQYKTVMSDNRMCVSREIPDQSYFEVETDHSNRRSYPSAKYKPGTTSGQSAAMSLGSGADAGRRNVSILSYNIWNTNSVSGRDKEYINRIKSLGKLCQRSEADVITFQEVRFQDDRGGHLGPNQLDHLSDLLPGYQFVYQPAQVQSDQLPGLTVEGVAIFSRHPIMYRSALMLSRNPKDVADSHQRVLMHAQIDIPIVGPIHVLTTHLSLSHEARLLSVTEISDYISSLAGPVFLSGDMNAEAHNDEVRFLAGKHSVFGRKMTDFHDIWEYQHKNCRHINETSDKEVMPKGLTFSALEHKLTKRIDLIFFKEHPRVMALDVMLVDNGLRGEKAASDHLGILAEFAVTADS